MHHNSKSARVFIMLKLDTIQKRKKTGWPVFHVCWAVQWGWFARGNALCNLSCKNLKKSWEVAASLPGRFLSRHWFTLCITVEVEPRIVKQYKCHHCCSCKNYRGKAMEGGKKVSLHCVLANQKIAILWKKMCFGAWGTSYCLLPDTFWLWTSKNAFKVAV